MDYQILNKSPDVAVAVVPHYVDANGRAIAAAVATPMPVSAPRAGNPVIVPFTPGQTSYGANKCIGNLIAFPTGLPEGTLINPLRMSVICRQADVSSAQLALLTVFEGNPNGSGTATSDNTTFAIGTADIAKVVTTIANAASGSSTVGGALAWVATIPTRISVDAGGNIYMSFASAATSLGLASGTVLVARLEYQY